LVPEGSFILAPPSVGSIGGHTMNKVAGIVRAASVLHACRDPFHAALSWCPTSKPYPQSNTLMALVCRDAARSHTKASSHSFVVPNGLPIVVASFTFIERLKVIRRRERLLTIVHIERLERVPFIIGSVPVTFARTSPIDCRGGCPIGGRHGRYVCFKSSHIRAKLWVPSGSSAQAGGAGIDPCFYVGDMSKSVVCPKASTITGHMHEPTL
jgi:hypothetical protein